MPEPTLNPRLDALLSRAADEAATAEEWSELEALLAADPSARRRYVQMMDLHAELRARHASAISPDAALSRGPSRGHFVWLQWRPLTAAAAGIAFGMLCTSVVFGLVAQRVGVMRKVPLVVYDPGMENAETTLVRGVPKGVGQWGADSATVVTTENGVQPLEGRRMLRLEPIPREKNLKNLPCRVYQVLDLRSLPMLGVAGDAEVQVTASFFAAKGEVSSRYLIRVFALNETPEQATQSFWPKSQEDGVVSAAQRFETPPGDRGWHTFSLKMPLPRGAQSLVFILGAGAADDASAETSVHYVDAVQVSVLPPQAALP